MARTELEAGKVLYLPQFSFEVSAAELPLFRPDILDPKSRNISLDAGGHLKGAAGDSQAQAQLAAMLARFRSQANSLIASLVPRYQEQMRLDPTSFRPVVVETRKQSVRADDRRLHVDAFPSRPNRGERLLRVFSNVNPNGMGRVWRVGEPFENMAQRFLPRAKPYSAWQARLLNTLGVTKTVRSEYDHLMLQLHDLMKADVDYQKNAPQETISFPPGASWVCFSDHALHAAMSGQFMLEQTFRLPVAGQYDPGSSPLAILTRMTGRELV